MMYQQVINVRDFRDALNESVPIRLDHFDHEVILEILNSVHHTLAKSESRAIELSSTGSKFLGVVICSPDSLKEI